MPKVVFLHPDLGIGGAERLIVDAAVALQQKGHVVHLLTAHHNPGHSFPETRDGTLSVTVHGDWLPRSLLGRCFALWAYVRMLYLALCLLCSSRLQPDVIVVDQVSIPIPILKWKCPRVIFYCHFPDQLLSKPGGRLKALYRSPLDWLEEWTTLQASKIFVNSKFTSKVFLKTFTSAKQVPDVLYPSLATGPFDAAELPAWDQVLPGHSLPNDPIVFLSLNRFERKKNVRLAVEAFDRVRSKVTAAVWVRCFLIIAGGYDELLLENVEHLKELQAVISKLDLAGKATVLKSPSEAVKVALLKLSRCLVYTPSNEHFGIVPVEAMYVGTPVLAVNSGGPTETVVDEVTGYLRPPTAEAFASALGVLACQPELAAAMGTRGISRVSKCFSFHQFAHQLDTAVLDLLSA